MEISKEDEMRRQYIKGAKDILIALKFILEVSNRNKENCIVEIDKMLRDLK